MAALAWLLIPVLAAIGAGLWGSWAGRHRKSSGDGPELAGYARFREAMERSHVSNVSHVSDISHVESSRSDAA
ncbi:hypothetical protein [Streptomyces cavernae]|uniref:hypothetical protein n=1 Tax=Streptomyces cavernae TaxID=2259034 RepID=UPI000FEB6D29|nr:hypothetical protein [Streptomyces cavernae]